MRRDDLNSEEAEFSDFNDKYVARPPRSVGGVDGVFADHIDDANDSGGSQALSLDTNDPMEVAATARAKVTVADGRRAVATSLLGHKRRILSSCMIRAELYLRSLLPSP